MVTVVYEPVLIVPQDSLYPILEGPSQWELVLALLDGERIHRSPVVFRVRQPRGVFDYPVHIFGLERLGVVGWAFAGSIDIPPDPDNYDYDGASGPTRGLYEAASGTGRMTLFEE